jgi:hypothetical protein
MFAIRDDRYESLSSDEQNLLLTFFFSPGREYIQQEDLTKAARKVGEAKKHESKHARPPPGSFVRRTLFLISCHHYSQTGCYSIAIDPLFTFLHPYRLLALRCNNQLYDITPLRLREQTTTLTHIQTYDLLPVLKKKSNNNNEQNQGRKAGISKPTTQKPKNRLFFSFSFPPFADDDAYDELTDRLLLVNERSAPDLATLRALTLLPSDGALSLWFCCCCCCCCGGGASRVKYRSS